MTVTPHPIGYVDFPTFDRKQTADFYAAVFGWEIDHHAVPYSTFRVGGLTAGGFPDLNDGFRPVRDALKPGDVLVYLEVEDIDEALEVVEDRGGAIVLEKTESAPGVFLAIITDPNGAKLAICRNENVQAGPG